MSAEGTSDDNFRYHSTHEFDNCISNRRDFNISNAYKELESNYIYIYICISVPFS